MLTLTVPERATITNMGAELGVTTSIFPSDEITRAFLAAQGRGDSFREIMPDDDAEYARIIDIDLSELEPLIACPHSPDKIKKVSEHDVMQKIEVNLKRLNPRKFRFILEMDPAKTGKKCLTRFLVEKALKERLVFFAGNV